MYVPGVTNRLALLSDPTGDILGTIQSATLAHFGDLLVPNAVLVLVNVPVFVRSRFAKQLIIVTKCIENIFPPLRSDEMEKGG